MDKIKAFLKLTRLSHGLFLVIAVMIGQLITRGIPSLNILIPSIITPIAISAGAFAINDYMDYETDKSNERGDRPLISGGIKKESALYISLILMPVGIVASAFINMYSFYIAILFAIISFAYSIHLKKVAIIGNLCIAASMTIPFIFGSLNVSNTVPMAIWVLSSMAFLSGTGREIVKSIQDIEGDKEQGRKTLPIRIGGKKSAYIATSLIIAAILISPYPYLNITRYLGSEIYLSTVLIANLTFLIGIYSLFKKDYSSFRRETYIAIGIGLLAFLVPVL
ncbi:MAG: UbiA family prenyltransferase [archaeon]